MYDLYMTVIILHVGYVGIFIFCKLLVTLGYLINRRKSHSCSESIRLEPSPTVENSPKHTDRGNMADIVGPLRQRDISSHILSPGKLPDLRRIQGKPIDSQSVQIHFFDDEHEIAVVRSGGAFGRGENILSGVEFHWRNDNHRRVCHVPVYLAQ